MNIERMKDLSGRGSRRRNRGGGGGGGGGLVD